MGHELKRLQKEHTDPEIEQIEVTTHPLRAWQDGIRIFPAIKIGDEVLSGIILTPARVREFIEERLKSALG